MRAKNSVNHIAEICQTRLSSHANAAPVTSSHLFADSSLSVSVSALRPTRLAQGAAVGAALNATLQLHVSDSELKQPLPSECVIMHHFYDPQQRAHAPASESAPAFAHVERADYRYVLHILKHLHFLVL